MAPSKIQTATVGFVAHCVKQLRQGMHPSLTENKIDSESLMCKKILPQQSHFYVERQMYHVILLTYLSSNLRNSQTEFERRYFLCESEEMAC